METKHEIKYYVNLFLENLESEKNYSENTISNYKLWFEKFIGFMQVIQNKHFIEDLTVEDILLYRSFLKSEGLSVKTINYHIVALRSFWKFLKRFWLMPFPLEELELSKIEPRKITFLTEEELKKLLSMPEKFEKNELKKYRDLAILHVLYGSWLRVSELINLKKEQVMFETNQLTIIWKGRKQRAVFLTKQAQEYLKKYFNLRNDNSDYVFISLSNNSYWKPLTRMAVDLLVREYSSLAWIEKKVTPHTLRHSFATTLLKNWADIRSVQLLLGHSSILTTQIYTHISDKHLQKVHSLIELQDKL